MPKFNLDPDKKIVKGKSRPSDRNIPQHGGKGGRVNTDWNVNWTPKKLTLTIALLGIPYVGVVLACFIAGVNIVAYLLITLAILVGLSLLLLRFIDQQDF